MSPYLSDFYLKYLESDKWKQVRRQALIAAGYRCQACGLYARHGLEVHHNTYKRLGHERPSDLEVYCSPCHEWMDERRRELAHWKKVLVWAKATYGDYVWDYSWENLAYQYEFAHDLQRWRYIEYAGSFSRYPNVKWEEPLSFAPRETWLTKIPKPWQSDSFGASMGHVDAQGRFVLDANFEITE